VADCEIANCVTGISGYYLQQSFLERNWIHDVDGSCINLSRGGSKVILDNRLTGCGSHGLVLGESNNGTQIVGNQIWHNGGNGVHISGTAGNVPARNIEIAFNTLVANRAGISLGPAPYSGVFEVRVRNNLVQANTANGILVDPAVTWSEEHNLFFDNGGDGSSGTLAVQGWDPTGLNPADVLGDPLLTDPAGGNFTPGALAIDAGVDLGFDRNGALPGDFNGVAPDIGAVETP
jgi:hypothetical protein